MQLEVLDTRLPQRLTRAERRNDVTELRNVSSSSFVDTHRELLQLSQQRARPAYEQTVQAQTAHTRKHVGDVLLCSALLVKHQPRDRCEDEPPNAAVRRVADLQPRQVDVVSENFELLDLGVAVPVVAVPVIVFRRLPTGSG